MCKKEKFCSHPQDRAKDEDGENKEKFQQLMLTHAHGILLVRLFLLLAARFLFFLYFPFFCYLHPICLCHTSYKIVDECFIFFHFFRHQNVEMHIQNSFQRLSLTFTSFQQASSAF